MSMLLFLKWLLFFESFVFVQAILANYDGGGYLTQSQLKSCGIVGWSFMEHGGMYADVFIVSPILARILSRYELPFWAPSGIIVLFLICAGIAIMGTFYSSKALAIPEAHSHGGKTSPAGWVHGVYALIGLWILILFYFKVRTSANYRSDVVLISIALTPFFFLGAVKFNSLWRPDKVACIQGICGPIIVWTITAYRLAVK